MAIPLAAVGTAVLGDMLMNKSTDGKSETTEQGSLPTTQSSMTSNPTGGAQGLMEKFVGALL